MGGDALLDARVRLVLTHVAAENDHDLEAVIATFAHPRYEIVPTGAVFDGEAEVRRMLLQQWADLPRLTYAAEGIFHSPEGIVVETRTIMPGGGRSMLSVNVFGFDGEDLVVERCYFDRTSFADLLTG